MRLVRPTAFGFDGGARIHRPRSARAANLQENAERKTMNNAPGYLVRYGLMGYVGRFPGPGEAGRQPERGQAVVLRTDRGLELGEVLLPLSSLPGPPGLNGDAGRPRLVRVAHLDDLAGRNRAEALRGDRFAACRQILDEAGWDVELIDVEVLLDQNTTVLHLLGAADLDLDLGLLRARFRSLSDFDVVPEFVSAEGDPARRDRPVVGTVNRGGCGDCDCGDGECGRRSVRESAHHAAAPKVGAGADGSMAGPCAASQHAACSDCGVSRWLSGKRPARI